jgi:hypothetical protein
MEASDRKPKQSRSRALLTPLARSSGSHKLCESPCKERQREAEIMRRHVTTSAEQSANTLHIIRLRPPGKYEQVQEYLPHGTFFRHRACSLSCMSREVCLEESSAYLRSQVQVSVDRALHDYSIRLCYFKSLQER